MLFQASRDVVTFMLQRQLQWGATLVILGVYNRTMLKQQARALDRPQARSIIAFTP